MDEENARIPSDLKPNRSGGLAGLYLLDACGAILQNAILAHHLALHDYGVLAVLLSVGMFVFVISDFGTGLAVSRLMALPPDETRSLRFSQLWTARMSMTGLTTAVAIVLSWGCAPAVSTLVLLIVGSEIFRSISNFFAATARGLGQVAAVMRIAGCERIGTLVCSVFAVTMGWGLQGVALAYVGARAVACIIACAWASWAGLSLRSLVPAKAIWRECVALAPLATLLLSDKIVFYSMPLVLVAGSSASETGLFNAALKIGLVPISLCSALLAAYFPDMVRDATEGIGPKSAVGVYFLVTVVGTPLIVLCFTFPQFILRTVFGPAFVQGSMTLRWIGFFVILNVAYQVTVHLLPAYGRESVLLRSASFGAALCLVVAAIVVRWFGSTGAASALVVYAIATLIPNIAALRGAFEFSASQVRCVVQGWSWFLFSVILAAPLAFSWPDNRLLLAGWVVLSALGGFALLFRHRLMLMPLLQRGGALVAGRQQMPDLRGGSMV